MTNRRDGVAWTMKHLIGVVWFRLGNYEEALACFARVPRLHEFRPATDECIQRSKSELAAKRESRPPAGPP